LSWLLGSTWWWPIYEVETNMNDFQLWEVLVNDTCVVRPFFVFEVGIVTRTSLYVEMSDRWSHWTLLALSCGYKAIFHLVTYVANPTVPSLEYYVHLSVITAHFNALQRSNSTPTSKTGQAVLYAKCHITSRVVNWPLTFTRHVATPLSIGRESAVGIATRYRLDVPGIVFLLGQDFVYPRRWAYGSPNPPYSWFPVTFRGIKRPGRGVDHPI